MFDEHWWTRVFRPPLVSCLCVGRTAQQKRIGEQAAFVEGRLSWVRKRNLLIYEIVFSEERNFFKTWIKSIDNAKDHVDSFPPVANSTGVQEVGDLKEIEATSENPFIDIMSKFVTFHPDTEVYLAP